MYAWTKDLETGNAAIDLQHKQLIEAINSLLEACSKGKGREQIGSTLKFLDSYIIKHFGDEESLQLKYNYPDYQNHKRYHEEFKKTVKTIEAGYATTGSSVALVSKVNSVIASWLITHIKREDVKVAKHIKSK